MAIGSLKAAAVLQPDSFTPLSLQVEWLNESGSRAEAVTQYRQLEAKVGVSEVDYSARMRELTELLQLKN